MEINIDYEKEKKNKKKRSKIRVIVYHQIIVYIREKKNYDDLP